MSYGMTYDEYWHGPPGIHRAFRKSFQMREKRNNRLAWLMGFYIYDAILDAAPVLSSRSKATKPTPYRTEPLDLTEEDRKEREEREQRRRYERIKERVALFAEEFNRKNSERKEVETNA